VRDLQLPWRHVIDEGEDKASVAYGVTGYPCKIIIDSDLNIVAKFLGESDGFYNKLDELLTKK
jgi:hypothetical protein